MNHLEIKLCLENIISEYYLKFFLKENSTSEIGDSDVGDIVMLVTL